MQGYRLKRDGGGGWRGRESRKKWREKLDTEKERWKRGGKGT